MNKTIFKFKFFDMPVTAPQSALIGSIAMNIICIALAVFFTTLTPLDSLIAGILATIIYWLSSALHQYGHFTAAKLTGYPSTGLRMWWVLGTTLYPRDEGQLPASVHIRRALGGPIMNFLVLIVFLLLWNVAANYSPMTTFLLAWGIFVQIGVYIVGALTPIRIGKFETDGGTLLRVFLESRRSSNTG